jgi:hypothetical protein
MCVCVCVCVFWERKRVVVLRERKGDVRDLNVCVCVFFFFREVVVLREYAMFGICMYVCMYACVCVRVCVWNTHQHLSHTHTHTHQYLSHTHKYEQEHALLDKNKTTRVNNTYFHSIYVC